MYMIHCTLIEMWVRKYLRKENAYLCTLSKREAKRYSSKQAALDAISRIPKAWREHMEVVHER